MNAEIISIGDELLIGQVINTNQALIAELANRIGIFVDRMTTVGDVEPIMLKTFERAFASHDVLLVTGGLGPTHDDITRSVVCTFFKTDLVQNLEALENVKRIFATRNLPLIKINEDQALVPRDCTVIQNHHGTAPGYLFERDRKYFIVMPGVPSEMEGMMREFVLPFFQKRSTGSVIRHRTLKTTGIAESILADRIGSVDELFSPDSGITLAFLPSPTGTRLRITVRSNSDKKAEGMIREVEEKIRAKASRYIYGVDGEELEDVVGKILVERKLTLAIAESCTGGLIIDRVTNTPGSSSYFERGMIVYSDNSKIAELGVPASLITVHGAVSREVAEAMALGIRTTANVDIGISTTGIAGPAGGSEEKPVGLVWIGFSDKKETLALRFTFPGNRRGVKERAAQATLEMLRKKLLKME